MKSILLLSGFFLLTLQSFSQSASYKFTDFDKAKSFAAKENKPILMVFAGSDWCRPCIQFKKEILESEAFEKYAKNNLTLIYLDFPIKKKNKLPEEQTKHNESLADKYNPKGAFPNILLVDAEGNILSKMKFHNQSPEDFIAECSKHL